MAVVIVSDDIPEIVQIANRVLIIHQGETAAEFEGTDIKEASLYKELAA